MESHTSLIILGCATFAAVLLGLFVNIWLFASIITSREIRVRMRNQIICSILILHLLEIVFMQSITFFKTIDILWVMEWPLFKTCYYLDYSLSMSLIETVISDYLIVIVCAIFLAQLLEFDPATRLTPVTLRLGKLAFLSFPWVLGLIAIPVSLELIAVKDYPCVKIDTSKHYVFCVIYTILPICLSIMLISAALLLRWRRFRLGPLTVQNNTGVQQMGLGAEIDNPLAYIAAVAVCVLCEIVSIFIIFEASSGHSRGVYFNTAAQILAQSRLVLLPFVWLFLRDIRERVKTWRIWHGTGPAPGVDLSVTYNYGDENTGFEL
ncbi:hypothetical protein PoB_007249700 [Plakobranchus ocellatus]|uniref:G-protein coupled receptors family 1 profile domain-containing protein n=1 Tax=Plakobranchus ocellatus TaxID=259542 RepID=A0AAV4DNQ3_9GAST|nr:hypothetical protein PoB_007249700 [Plakobranchus ocellatus]